MAPSSPPSTGGAVAVVGKTAPDFTLPDHAGRLVTLSKLVESGPVLLAFYPRDFTAVCTRQLCDYSDNFARFGELGLQVVGISDDAPASHAEFAKKYKFPFKLLTDLEHKVARAFGATSMFMFGKPTRAVFIVSSQRSLLYKRIEPTVMTHRGADELLKIAQDLRRNKLI